MGCIQQGNSSPRHRAHSRTQYLLTAGSSSLNALSRRMKTILVVPRIYS